MSEPFWYRRVSAIARFPERHSEGPFRTIKLAHEEPLEADYSEHLGRVADLLQRAGVSDDMGDGSTITFHVSYRGEQAS